MICVSIGEKDYRKVTETASLYPFAEIRLDLLEKVDRPVVEHIFRSHNNLIATFRNNGQSEEFRTGMLGLAVGEKASFVDADINESAWYIRETERICSSAGISDNGIRNCRFIISYHNYEETPEIRELDEIVETAFSLGADIAKIACAAGRPEHVERLLSLPEVWGRGSTVIAGMGLYGGRVRILSRFAGSFFTYASPGGGRPTAEGQLDYLTLLEEQRRLENA